LCRVYRLPSAAKPAVDVLVDLSGRHPACVHPADNHSLVCPGGRGLVILERHADELVARSQRVHDLRRRRQQRHQAHDTSVDAPLSYNEFMSGRETS
jgi:hypothetical protein